MSNKISSKKEMLVNFRKTQSLLSTIIKMVEEDKYCVDVMQQNLAAIGLLKKANEKLMNNHLKTCFLSGIKSGSAAKQNQMIAEIESVISMGSR